MKVFALVALTAILSAPGSQERKPGQELSFPLSSAGFRKGQFRAGYNFSTDPPLKGWKSVIGSEVFLFFDMNGDEALTLEQDGLAVPNFPFVVPVPGVLLTKSGQFEIAFDGTARLKAVRQDLGIWNALVPELALLTSLRIQAGVRPVRFDVKASSDCEKHCDYVKLNGGSGMSLHEEDPKKKGYTPEGAAAAKGSDIDPGGKDFKSSVMGWYQSVWHRVPMVNASLKTVGYALKHGMAMLYFFERGAGGESNQCHPPDGATDVPVAFDSGGEMPNPVPNTAYGRGCGFPVIVLLRGERHPLVKATVTDAAGRPVPGTESDPSRPANPQWPTNSGCAAFVPAKTLAGSTTYKARFEFSDSPPLEWSFTTGR